MLNLGLLRRAALLALVWAIFFYTHLLVDLSRVDESVLIANAVDAETVMLVSGPARLLLKSRVTSGDVLIPQLFLNMVNGVDLNSRERQRLFDLAEGFIRAGFDVNITYDGRTALHYAVLYNEPDTVTFLLQNGANPDRRIRRPGHASNGLNARQYARHLAETGNKRQKMAAVIGLLEP